MTALALYRQADPSETRRWSLAALAILLAHGGLLALALDWSMRTPQAGDAATAIMIDLAPAPAAPQIRTEDVAPGPEMEEAEAAAPELRLQPQTEDSLPATPQQPDPVVTAPPKPETPPQPEPAPPTPVRQALKRPAPKPPAPRTTAPPKAERVAPAPTSVATSGAAAAAAAASYRDRLAAHLQRFKQYPAGSRAAGEQGTVRLSFVVSRSGAVLGASLASSSGSRALDAETLAMVRRAQPLPAFPSEMRQTSLSFTVPIRYSLR